jgi:hypothetical protein
MGYLLVYAAEINFIWWFCFIVKVFWHTAATKKLVGCLEDMEDKLVASPFLRRNNSLWNSRLGRFVSATVFFAYLVSKGASMDPSPNKRPRSAAAAAAIAQACAIVGAPWGNLRELGADSEEEEGEMSQDDLGYRGSVAGGSTDVRIELGAPGPTLAGTAAAAVGVTVVGAVAVCAVSAASAAIAKRLSIVRSAESSQARLTSDLVQGCSGVVTFEEGVSQEDAMVSNLSQSLSLNNQWERFVKIFTRGSRAEKNLSETFLRQVQQLMNIYLRDMHMFCDGNGRDSKLFFCTAYDPSKNIAVTYESTCGGMAKAVLGTDVFVIGAFSKALDKCPSSMGRSKSNVSRTEKRLYKKKLLKLIQDLEKNGAYVMVIFNGIPLESGDDSSDTKERRQLYATTGFPLPETTLQTDSFSSSSSSNPSLRILREFELKLSDSVKLGLTSDYSLATLAAVFSGKEPSGNIYTALGLSGLETLVGVYRSLRSQRGRHDASYRPSAVDSAQEIIFYLGVGTRTALKSSKKNVQKGSSSSSSSFGHSMGVSDDNDYDMNDYGGDNEDSTAFSASSNPGGFTEFIRLGRHYFSCVHEENQGDEVSRTYALPRYTSNGADIKVHKSFVLLTFTTSASGSGGGGASVPRCKCSYSIKARSVRDDSPDDADGCISGLCFHQHLRVDAPSSGLLRSLPCAQPPSALQESSYHHILIATEASSVVYDVVSEPFLAVFVHAPAAVGVNVNAIVTLTSNHVTCSECHVGKKQEIKGARPPCAHAQHIKMVIDNASVGGLIGDALRFNVALSDDSDDSHHGNISFDVAQRIWVGKSLSSMNETDNYERLGETAKPVNAECSIDEIDPTGCHLGGPADAGVDIAQPLIGIEPIPTCQPPRSFQDGCVYCDDDHPNGFSDLEKDATGNAHPHAKVHFLSHSRLLHASTRHCSCGHAECVLLYTGRFDGIHRESHETSVRHEVILLWWMVLKNTGSGTEPFGRIIQELHRLGGGGVAADARAVSENLFMKSDTLRKCTLSYLARQRRKMLKACPSCPKVETTEFGLVSSCPIVTVDAKRLRIPVRLHSGVSPDQTSSESPQVDVHKRCISQRYMWPGAAFKPHRLLVRSLAAKVLGKALEKDESPFKPEPDANLLLQGAPGGFKRALELLLKFEELNASSSPSASVGDDCDDDEVEEHSGLEGDQTEGEDGDNQPGLPGGALEVAAESEAAEVAALPSFPWVSPTEVAGVRRGDILTHLNGTAVHGCHEKVTEIATSDAYKKLDVVTLTLRREGNTISVEVHKGSNGTLGMDLDLRVPNEGESGDFQVIKLNEASDGVMPQPAEVPTRAILHELAVQFHGTSNKQCEFTQWLNKSDRDALRIFLASYYENGGLVLSDIDKLESSIVRRSVVRLIRVARYQGLNGKTWLHPAVHTMICAMVKRSNDIHVEAQATPARVPLAAESAAPYDPSTGVAYHFTASGRRLYRWPRHTNLSSASKCTCRKPDWMRIAPKGMTEGVLTFMCLRSGVVLGTTFLTGAEGCKDAGSALYSYHPLVGLKSVVCDTPCMHAMFMNTRAPREFDDIKWAGDRFHIPKHKCLAIYDPQEYAWFDHLNTSMIEQWHAIMHTLTRSVRGTHLPHAMLLLQTLQDDHYNYQCTKYNYPESAREW